MDESVRVRIEGTPPGARVVLSLASRGAPGTVMLSRATFAAAEGDIDLARDAPIAGSYTGIDAMGLFWSRSPHQVADLPAQVHVAEDPMTVSLTVQADGQVLSQEIRRYFQAPDVVATELKENGLVGHLFTPPGGSTGRAMLVVGGSNGGLLWSREVAALLAAQGHTALALAYFGMPTLPSTLDRIPLEYFERALGWLAARTDVDALRIGVCGVSRGGELALLLGATFPAVRAVVAYVPSGLLWGADPFNFHGAWTRHGRELPAAQITVEEWNALEASGRLAREPHVVYDLILADRQQRAATAIAVEKIAGSVLMVSGGADGVWPSSALAGVAEERLRAHAFAHRCEHWVYPEAGHAIGIPNLVTTQTRFKHLVSGEQVDLGGTPASNAQASRDSWPRMIAFLETSL